MMSWIKQKLTGILVRYLTGKVRNYEPFAVSPPEILESVLQVTDVILVEGNQRFSTAVKYLTQSIWSHAAIYVGHARNLDGLPDGTPAVIEADLQNGVIAVPLSKYEGFNTRICRPIGLSSTERHRVSRFMVESLGMSYDLKNVIDLARHLIPTPPVLKRFRRSMLALGSGDPTRARWSPIRTIHAATLEIHFGGLSASPTKSPCRVSSCCFVGSVYSDIRN